jgi:hypothetical protein
MNEAVVAAQRNPAGLPPIVQAVVDGQPPAVTAGGKAAGPKGRKSKTKTKSKAAAPRKASSELWTSFPTWVALSKDKKALDQYWKERSEVGNHFPSNWNKVRQVAHEMVHSDREWAGLINIVDGVPQIVSKHPSPLKAGEGLHSGEVEGAVVPASLINKINKKPALFMYHTHPAGVGAQWPSPHDLANSILHTYRGHYLAHVVIASDVIYLYGVNSQRTTQIWDDPHPNLAVIRFAFDTFNAFSAMRSYESYYPHGEMEKLATKLGLLYAHFPTDEYAHVIYNRNHRLSQLVDLRASRYHLDSVANAQRATFPDLG